MACFFCARAEPGAMTALPAVLRHFDVLRHGAEVFDAGLGDEHKVLDADAADVVVVQAGFDGDHVAGLEQLEIARGEAGLFVDLEPDAVSEAVEVAAGESLVVDAGLESGFGERLDAEVLTASFT